ncbi:MAG: hypothetical protein OXT67_01740 [Zetaproteobacteria bacterium]|nr:hypothetical protein [Zetaproteobacteria bacterium]
MSEEMGELERLHIRLVVLELWFGICRWLVFCGDVKNSKDIFERRTGDGYFGFCA